MTEQQLKAIEDAPATKVPDVDNDGMEDQQEFHSEGVEQNNAPDDSENDVEFPKKAVNALNRKNKQISKLRAQMRELEAKLNENQAPKEKKVLNPDDFESYGDYINAQVEALVDQKTHQSQTDMQKAHIAQQKQVLQAQRDQYILEQAKEASKTLTDLPYVWQQNAEVLDALPKDVADIFYSIDNAPAAIYMLAKEGKLQDLMYANPAVAAYEIVTAQNKGLEMLSRPAQRVSRAPEPIAKAKGNGSVKKQLSPNDDVLKSLGFKK